MFFEASEFDFIKHFSWQLSDLYRRQTKSVLFPRLCLKYKHKSPEIELIVLQSSLEICSIFRNFTFSAPRLFIIIIWLKYLIL